jgi:hypothetical protein
MSRTTAPLLSFGASGQLGETLVFSRWKGRPYARRYVIPANPRTAAQTLTRDVFRTLNRLWQYMPAAATAAWELYADNSRITSRNGWIKQNLSVLREATDLSNILISPAAGGGLVAESVTATPGAGQITVALTAPALPTGWTIVAAWAAAIADHDPHSDTSPEIVSGTDESAPYSIVLTGLEPDTDYVVGGWFEYLKPDGSKAYGASLQDLATTT